MGIRDNRDDGSAPVLVLVAVAYGAVLNLFAARWRDTDCLLEKRRNDFVALALWMGLALLTILIAAGVGVDVDLNLEEWVVILLPWAAGTQNVLRLLAARLREVEMWEWLNQSTYRILPVAWMYRTMTRGEHDDDGKWLREGGWDPQNPSTFPPCCGHPHQGCNNSFRRSATRKATMTYTVNEWRHVLQSAFVRVLPRLIIRAKGWKPCGVLLGLISLSGVAISLVLCLVVLGALCLTENALFYLLDFIRWVSHYHHQGSGVRKNVDVDGFFCRDNEEGQEDANKSFSPIVRYESVQLGQGELKILYDTQKDFSRAQSTREDNTYSASNNNREVLRDSAMTAIASVAGLLQNAFRKAYLVTPTYKETISSRRVLRPLYSAMGLDLDVMIKSVRHVLELRHGSGLLSLANRIPASGTIEAALHDNIEALLTITFFWTPQVLYSVAETVASIEDQTLKRASSELAGNPARQRLAEVVAIDTRNFCVWLLWLEIVHRLVHDKTLARIWSPPDSAEKQADSFNDKEEPSTWTPKDETEEEVAEPTTRKKTSQNVLPQAGSLGLSLLTPSEIESLYVMASFLSRCRYLGDTDFDLADTGEDVLGEILGLVRDDGGSPSSKNKRMSKRKEIEDRFKRLSRTLREHTGRCLLTWAEIEHSEVALLFPNKNKWHEADDNDTDLLFTWSRNPNPRVCRIAPDGLDDNNGDDALDGDKNQQQKHTAHQPRKSDILERVVERLPGADYSVSSTTVSGPVDA